MVAMTVTGLKTRKACDLRRAQCATAISGLDMPHQRHHACKFAVVTGRLLLERCGRESLVRGKHMRRREFIAFLGGARRGHSWRDRKRNGESQELESCGTPEMPKRKRYL
jgi:hypothetical protein